MEDRVHGALFRILPLVPASLILGLVAAAALTSGVVRGPGAGACEPRTWIDWHVAVKTECVARTYVCHNMTASQLMRDPAVVEAYQDALASNDRDRIREMDVLIGQIRAAYGCGAAPERLRPAFPGRRPGDALPPGHPPVRGAPGRGDPALGLDRTI
jgi:hypothetical protein